MPIQRHPAEDEMNLEVLRTRLQEVVSKKAQLHDEAGLLETEIASSERVMFTRQYDMDLRRFRDVEAGYRAELTKAQIEYDQLQNWNNELSRGNLQLQTIKTQLEEDNHRLQEDKNVMAAELRRMETRLTEVMSQPKDSQNGRSAILGPGHGSGFTSNYGQEISQWLTEKFASDAKKEQELKRLVEDFSAAGWKDLGGRVQELLGFVNSMGTERQSHQARWASLLLFTKGETSAVKSDSGE